MPVFGGMSPVEFQPLNEQDEPRADQETRAVNHVANTAGIYMTMQAAVQDVLLRRAGVVKVYWDRRAKVSYEDHDNVPLAALPQLLQETPGESVTVVRGELSGARMEDLAQGVGMEQAQGGVTLRRHRLCSRPKMEPVPLNEILISSDFFNGQVDEGRFVCHQRPVSRSLLVELGVDPDVVAELPAHSAIGSRLEERSRDQNAGAQWRSAHESTEFIMVCESYYRIDLDGDGIAERRRVITAGGTDGTDHLLMEEPWDEQPFAIGIGYLGVYTWDGVSLFDRLKMIQDVKTRLIRALTDAAQLAARQRIGAVEGDANLDDVMTSVVGGVIRLKTSGGVVPIPEIRMPSEIMGLLNYADEMRKDKGGGAIDATASAQVLGQGGDWSLERLMSAIEQINAMVARNLAETLFKPIYRRLHKLLRENQTEAIPLQGQAGWEYVQPQAWSPREDMVISLGMSVGERSKRIGVLQNIIQQQTADSQAGMMGVLVDQNGMYQARVDLARMAGLPTPEQYYVDPSSPQAQQAQQAAQQQAQQAQQQQMQQQQEMMRFQYKMLTDIEKVKAEAKLVSDQMKDQTDKLKMYLQQAEKMFSHRVKLAELEQETDVADAQLAIDEMQAVASLATARAQRGES